MKKINYIQPETIVVALKAGALLQNASLPVHRPVDPGDYVDDEDDVLSNRRPSVWDDEEDEDNR